MGNFIMINENFKCDNCYFLVKKNNNGGVRNHCPNCLFSKHLDSKFPGDRKSECFGLMKPVGIDYKKNKGFMIKHKCLKCQKEILNKLSKDDNMNIYNNLNKNK